MPYWQFYYHLVWATKRRDPIIDEVVIDVIGRVIKDACRQHEAIPHAVGFMPDHMHVAVSIPPKVAVADFIGKIKGKSSFELNQTRSATRGHFQWQTEYGALSFGEKSLASVVAYVKNQAIHHAENTLWPSFERLDNLAIRSPRSNPYLIFPTPTRTQPPPLRLS